jgi:hypothetical protein
MSSHGGRLHETRHMPAMAGRRGGSTGMAEQRSMTSAVRTRAQVLRERGAEATRRLRDALQLAPDLNDATVLGTALAEYMAERSRTDPHIAQELRRRYDELMALGGGRARRASRQTETLPPLVAVGHMEPGERLTINPAAPPDPRFLIRVYGREQLARALQPYMVEMLKETAEQVEREHPGTKPTNRGQRKALIDYIVRYST